VPKGSYVPVFRAREVQEAPPAPRHFWRPLFLILAGCLLAAGVGAWRVRPRGASPAPVRTVAGLAELDASDARLAAGFRRAKQLALASTYSGDAIGDWYESTTGTRYAFCMRDVAHQSQGAAILALQHTHGTCCAASPQHFRRAEVVRILGNQQGRISLLRPTTRRSTLRYCLPANFDVMQACYRQFPLDG
jgi:hypothetical protein